MTSRRCAFLTVPLLTWAGPAAALDFVVTNCATAAVSIYTYNDNDPVRVLPAYMATVGPSTTQPVRCYTPTCVISYSMGGRGAILERPFTGDVCVTATLTWKGSYDVNISQQNCSMECR